MSGFADLVPRAMPALIGGGFASEATEGRTWSWVFVDITDDTGAAINLASGVTASCTIWDATSGLVVVSPTVTLGSGTLTVTVAKAATVGLALDKRDGRRCVWGLELDNSTVAVQVWGPANSTLTIFDEDGIAL